MKSKHTFYLFLGAVSAVFYCCNKTADAPKISPATLVLPSAPAQYYGQNDKMNKVATLGRVLFYDNHLSLNNAISCGSCHKQAFAFADDVALSNGFENRLTMRNTPAIQDVDQNPPSFAMGVMQDTSFSAGSLLFWDGRETNIQNLIMRPVNNHVEMGIEDLNTLPGKLAALPYYRSLFMDAFGSPQITVDRISVAVSMFVTSIKTGNSRFENYMRTGAGFNALEREGLSLFTSKYNCNSCHNTTGQPGGYFTSSFIDNGLSATYTDMGRGEVTGMAADDGKFKAPQLHNIALTAPYMHDGRFKTLGEVIDFYSQGINKSPNLDQRLWDMYGNAARMNISAQEKQALIAFLNSLTDYQMISDPKFSDPFKASR